MNHINRTKFRKINIHGEIYLWKRGHYHIVNYEFSECVEKVIVYLEGKKKSPLQLIFKQDDNKLLMNTTQNKYWCVGYPQSGAIWYFDQSKLNDIESIEINLNRPAVIRKLIEYYVENNWFPKEDQSPYVVPNALKLLELIEFPKGIN